MSSLPPLRAVRRRLPLLGGALVLSQLPAAVLFAQSGWPGAEPFLVYLAASAAAAAGLFATALALWRRIARIVELVEGYAENGRLPEATRPGARGSLESVRASLTTLDRLVRGLELEAARDPLTGVSNRRAGAARLEEDLAQSLRTGVPFSIALFDLDRLKEINDLRGHAAGDEALRRLAHGLRDALREGDWVARWGGDEFLLGMWGSDAEAAAAGALRRMAERAFYLDGERAELGASVGFATLSPKDDPELLFARADEALLAAKRTGRGRMHRASSNVGE